MGNSHSCTEFRGGMIGAGCNPATGHTNPPPAPKPPPVKPYTQTQSAIGLQGASKNIFNTSNMGTSNAQASYGHY